MKHCRDLNKLEKMLLLLFYQSNFKHPQIRVSLAVCLASLHLLQVMVQNWGQEKLRAMRLPFLGCRIGVKIWGSLQIGRIVEQAREVE